MWGNEEIEIEFKADSVHRGYAYGLDVHEGLGNHEAFGRRPFLEDVTENFAEYMRRAIPDMIKGAM